MVRESSIRPGLVEFVPETNRGTTPSNPSWEAFSAEVRSLTADVDPQHEGGRSIFDIDIDNFFRGNEDATLDIEYLLQRSLATVNFSESELDAGGETLQVASTDSGDTNITVTIWSDDGQVVESVTTDGTDATTKVSTTDSFDSVGRVTVGSSHSGEIEVFDSGGNKLGGLASGTTTLDDISPTDASAYFITRNLSNEFRNAHSILARKDQETGGNDSGGIRKFVVVKGAIGDEVTYSGDAGESDGIPVTISYQVEKLRKYAIHQPSSSTLLALKSTDSGDTSIDVEIEDREANTTETVTLDGSDATTLVSTSSNFDNVDAIEPQSELAGDLEVFVNSGSQSTPTEGSVITKDILGSSNYDGTEGDLGVPALGTGSHATDPTDAFEFFLDDTVEYPSGTDIASELQTTEITVSNNVQAEAQTGLRQALQEGSRQVSATTNVMGPTVSIDSLLDSLKQKQQELVWKLSANDLYLEQALLTTPGMPTEETEQAILITNNEYTAEGVTIE